MNPNSNSQQRRDELTADILQQIANEVQETLLFNAPKGWPTERLEEIEEEIVAHSRHVLDALTIQELSSAGALRVHIGGAVAETKRLVHQET